MIIQRLWFFASSSMLERYNRLVENVHLTVISLSLPKSSGTHQHKTQTMELPGTSTSTVRSNCIIADVFGLSVRLLHVACCMELMKDVHGVLQFWPSSVSLRRKGKVQLSLHCYCYFVNPTTCTPPIARPIHTWSIFLASQGLTEQSTKRMKRMNVKNECF